jgi:hypothetical protein
VNVLYLTPQRSSTCNHNISRMCQINAKNKFESSTSSTKQSHAMSKKRSQKTRIENKSSSRPGQTMLENSCMKTTERRDSLQPLLDRSITCFSLTRHISEITIDLENEVSKFDCTIDYYCRQNEDFVNLCYLNVPVNDYTDDSWIRHSSLSTHSNTINIATHIADNFRHVRPIRTNDVSPKLPIRRGSINYSC